MSREQDYSLWTSMKSRCANSKDKDYARYGGRGIIVCERWKASFDDFMKDMGARPEGMTLDRINNDGNYEPDNCKWATRKEQAGNRSHAEKSGTTHEFDAEVFSVGTWNGDKYNEQDLDNMVSNFNALGEAVKPPVKLGHNDKQTKDGQPAIGWVKAIKRVGGKLIATLTEVPEILYKAIKGGLYKRVSSEIYWNYKHSGNVYKRVLGAVALLGADIPAVSNLEDLQAFLSQSTADAGSFDRACAYSFDVDKTGQILTEKAKGFSQMEEKQYQDEIAKLKADNAVKDTAIKAAEEKAEEEAAGKKAYKEKVESERLDEKKKVRFEEVKAFCEAMVKDGRMLPATRDIIVDGKHNYTDGDYVFSFDTFKKVTELQGKVVEFSKEHGNDKDKDKYTDAGEEVAKRTEEYAAKHNVDYVVASNAVLAADSELAKMYAQGGDE